jgi:hypothetical protein
VSRRILLVEPDYKNKYPPLGLMKISTYHKRLGDSVTFVKGCVRELRDQKWDRVYVATLFTFYWRRTTETIRYYLPSVTSCQDIYVGGVMATLMGDEIEKEINVRVIRGLLDRPGLLDSDSRIIIDHLIPDYRILQEIDYDYGVGDAYIGYATRGCVNRCRFCAVKQLEPEFVHYLSIKKQVRGIEEVYGPRKDLLLLDNNVLASDEFPKIISDILDLGFEKNAHYDGKLRRLDFNQGIDARRLTKKKVKLLARTCLNPLRMAFDRVSLKKVYLDRVKLARDHGLLHHTPYVLYNYRDTPQDFYERLRTNVLLNEELGTKISSFPMKYVPLTAKDRRYVGEYWNRRLIRGVQCILLVTRGIVSPRREFFDAAFGRSSDEFEEIAMMPDEYIIYRKRFANNKAREWRKLYRGLGANQRCDLIHILSKGRVDKDDVAQQPPSKLKRLLYHYVGDP